MASTPPGVPSSGMPAIDLGKIGPYGVLGMAALGIRELWLSAVITSNEALLAYVLLSVSGVSLALVLTLRTDIKTMVDKVVTAIETVNKSIQDNTLVLQKLAERTRIEDLIVERREDEQKPARRQR